MNLLEKASIIKIYIKNLKKSILDLLRFLYAITAHFLIKTLHFLKNALAANKIDVFIILVLFFMIIVPLIFNFSSKKELETKQVSLFISPNCEDLFGSGFMEDLLLEFEEKYPDIRIRMAYDTAVKPHILFLNEGDYSIFAADNALMELNSFTNYESGTRQLAIPLVSFMDMLFYNIDILTAAGFDHPPKTREEFITYARAVSRGGAGAAGAAISLSSDDHHALSRDIFSWIWTAGGNFWANGEKPSLNTRAITNDISFLGTLNRDNLLAPDIFETTGDQRVAEFAEGKTAMMIASTQAIPFLRERMGDDAFGITTVPSAGTGGRYAIGISAIYAGISAGADHPDEAWNFLAFLAEKSQILCKELKAVPGLVSSIISGDYVQDDAFYSKAWDIFLASNIAESFSGRPNAQEYEAVFLEELRIFFEEGRTAQATVNAIQQRWDEIGKEEETDENIDSLDKQE
ncbi:MAG: extracellular solute-binding protein [Treponema sp.]|nr:extracellular solute-binding protein [Treponema sp.]